MKKRIFAVMLAALLSLSLLAGCGSDKNGDDTTTTTTTVANDSGENLDGVEDTDPSGDVSDPSGDASDPSGEETETTETDAQGNTVTTKTKTKVTIGQKTKKTTTTKTGGKTTANQGGQSDKPLTTRFSMPFEDTMKWSLYMTEHAYQPIKGDTIKFDALYELTNVEFDIDVGEGASAQTKLMAAAASGKMYDITYLNNTQFRTYKTSLFYDLTDRIKTDLPNYYAMVKNEWADLQLFSTGGRFYGFAQHEYKYLYDEQGVLGVYIRADVLEDNNIKKPTTWKEWFEAMKLLKKKYPDSQPYASRTYDYCLRYWTQQLGQAYQIYYNSKTEKWECGVLNAGLFKNVLQFMKDCYDEGILDQNFDKSSDKNWLDMAIASQTFTTVDSGPLVAQANEQLQKTNKDAKFIMIAPLSSHLNGNKTTTWYWPQSINYQSMYYISSQAKNMEELLYFMDWCYTEEGANTNNYGKLHETYEIDKNGMAYVPEKLWKEKWPTGGNNNVYEWMSAFGLNQLCFAPLMNNNDQRWENWDWAPEEDSHQWEMDGPVEYAKGYALAQFNLSPDVDSTMTARYDTIQAYLRNQVISFVKGNRPMSEFDTFIADLKSMGVEELIAACNA